VTNARAFSVRHCQRYFAQCITLCLLVLPLAGCETSTLLGGNSTASTTAPTGLAAAPGGHAKLAFAPIVGAPATVADMLSGSVASATERQSIPVSHTTTDVPDYTVRGYLVAAPDKAGTKLSYIWDVTDKTGQRAKRITGEEILKGGKSKDPWAQVDQSVVDKIAASTATQLAAWVPMKGAATPIAPTAQNTPASTQTSWGSSFGSSLGQIFGFGAADQTATATPAPATPAPAAATAAPAAMAAAPPATAPPAQTASLGGPKPGSLITGTVAAPAAPAPTTTASLPPSGDATTVVPAVIGAPGDGATALTAALQHALTGSGVKLASAGGTGSYTVQGHVTMGQPAGGKQTIKIEWQVIDPAGKKVGTVSQNNVVPQGSLDGPWGKTADQAAAAAAQGVLKLLPHQTASN